MRYIHEFQNRITKNFTQWINGSFISQKENPKDIDFVTFLDHKTYEVQEVFLDRFWSFSLEDKGLDAYLIAKYPEGHQEYEIYKEKEIRFYDLYSSTKEDALGNYFDKGFIELKFE